MTAAVTNILSSNFLPPLLKSYPSRRKLSLSPPKSLISSSVQRNRSSLHFSMRQGLGEVQVRRNSLDTGKNETVVSSEGGGEDELLGGGGGGDGGGEERDWTTSILLFVFWLGVMYYVFFIAPNQTPATDIYFAKKLLFFIRNDGFEMNKVLVAVWNMMGIWPLVYAMLLIPTGRSYNRKIPVWPFIALSSFLGIYGLMPYFVLWRPPAPRVEKSELKGWPLKILESKVTAGIALAGGIGLMIYGLTPGTDAWKEFYQIFRGSKLVNITSVDFVLCSAFAPFWVYNDITTRKWSEKGSWLIPVSAIPLLGPTVYLLLRPSLSSNPKLLTPASDDE